MAGAPEGNTNAQKFTLQEWIEKFEQVYDNSKKGKYDSLQKAWIDNDIRPTTVKYLVNRHIELSNIKEDINNAIISNINTKALKGDFNSTASIWRMKQLGERDSSHVDHTSGGEKINTENKVEVIIKDNSEDE